LVLLTDDVDFDSRVSLEKAVGMFTIRKRAKPTGIRVSVSNRSLAVQAREGDSPE
jgi:hypothetical protein